MTEEISEIHRFWFGQLDEAGISDAAHQSLWFASGEELDHQLREGFGGQVQQALDGSLDHWADSDRGLIALVVLLDQFTRNIYRGTPQAFSGDGRALALSQKTIETGHHQRLPAIHQVFLYMPLEHSENLDHQEECVTLFEELTAITGSEAIAGFGQYAVAHRDVIARFGRFPHRNAILGRESTQEELAYLKKHGGF